MVRWFLPGPKKMTLGSSSILRREFLCRIILTSGGSVLALAQIGCGTSGETDATVADDAKVKRKENLLKGTKPVKAGKSGKGP